MLVKYFNPGVAPARAGVGRVGWGLDDLWAVSAGLWAASVLRCAVVNSVPRWKSGRGDPGNFRAPGAIFLGEE